MARYIDSDKLEKHFRNCILECINTHQYEDSEIFRIVLQAVENQPTADVVKVVRCKDCALRKTEDCAMYYECDCGVQYTWESDKDYCSWGKRKEDEE